MYFQTVVNFDVVYFCFVVQMSCSDLIGCLMVMSCPSSGCLSRFEDSKNTRRCQSGCGAPGPAVGVGQMGVSWLGVSSVSPPPCSAPDQ